MSGDVALDIEFRYQDANIRRSITVLTPDNSSLTDFALAQAARGHNFVAGTAPVKSRLVGLRRSKGGEHYLASYEWELAPGSSILGLRGAVVRIPVDREHRFRLIVNINSSRS
jgi:hypothetical protein